MEKNHKLEAGEEHDPGHALDKNNKIRLIKPIMALLVLVALLTLFNQYQIGGISEMIASDFQSADSLETGLSGSESVTGLSESKDLTNVKASDLKSTGHSIAALFSVEDVATQDDAIGVIISTGIPAYGTELGVSFDDPVGSLNFMAEELYPSIKQDIKQNYPDIWQRYVSLATKPVGISCEFCCGLNAVSVGENGELLCGCKHNPAMHGLVMWLMKNTNYSDVEIIKEALKWKALWYPKDMVKLTLQVAGKDASSLAELPGMVGGC